MQEIDLDKSLILVRALILQRTFQTVEKELKNS